MIGELWNDLSLIFFALIAICTYLLLFLGSMSPLHSRIFIVGLGLGCIGVACAAGFGLCFQYGWLQTEITQILPPMMLGIGVDDMFVICNAIDQ